MAQGFSFQLDESPPAGATTSDDSSSNEEEAFSLDFGPPTEAPTKTPETPAIKSIRFPGAPSPTPSPTRFSASVGHRRPQFDSTIDEEDSTDDGTDLAPPEDLPDPTHADADWAPETPTAAALWKRAGSAWQQTRQQASTASAKGVEHGRALADGMSQAVRERIEQLRQQGESRPKGSEPAAEPTPARAAPEAQSARQASLGESHSASVPAPAERVVQLRVPGAGQLVRKLAAPLSAAAAAVVVYVASGQLLGTTDGIALSKANAGPVVPDLGTLHAESAVGTESEERKNLLPEADRRRNSAPEGSEESDASPPAMQTELAPMPDGLSWPGKGLIEVVTAEDELVYVDGVFTGRGPLRRIPVTPGDHEISIRTGGTRRDGEVEVRMDSCTRAVFAGE